ncbi:hypothetical protein KK062_20255 [Fulvivirgaceae bacterium PWU5]|uniref:Tetratricopeptide repeat protein n=1 Tax=Dawidia cretensis TaxID=2782350 RepID=A0AAP2E018_9BACT|nr:hypothetical protein [Dawidia cretensis]MBT1710588.1 hypothetical protein [Dawidia cretensis]
MQSRFFWKLWPRGERRLWYGAALLFFASLTFLWFSYFQGLDGILTWDNVQEQKVVETNVHIFRLGPFQLQVPAESYVVFDYFNGSMLTPNTTASYIFLAVLAIGLTVLITVISTMERFWFLMAMGIFILLLVALRLEVLGLMGQYNRIPIVVVLIVYTVPAFYFARFAAHISPGLRLLVFAAVTAVLGGLVAMLSSVEQPFHHLAVTAYAPALVLSVLFIILVAHEIFAGFLAITSGGSSKSLRHFCIISLIYFANLVITCMHRLELIDWNFVYINLYLLLTVSAVLGIWGFRHREPIYADIIAFRPAGAYFYLALGAICFATVGQLLGNANGPALEIVGDAIIFSHTAYGVIFVTYIFSNFILMMARSMQVYKVLYTPNRMPYFTYRLAGTIAMLGFVFVSDWHAYIYNGMAGFYNATGDLYAQLGNEQYAQSFYEQSSHYAPYSNRAHYALGTMKAAQLDFEGAQQHYAAANLVNPTPYSLANAANLLSWQGDTFGAIESLRLAHRQFANSGPILNNLGRAYTATHNIDSSLVYLSRAKEKAVSKDAAETNFFALVAAERIPFFKTDSTLSAFGAKAPSTQANALALASLYRDTLRQDIRPLANTVLNLQTATLLNNYILYHVRSLDTTFLNAAYRLAADSVNASYSEALKATLSYGYYHQGNVAQALQLLAEQVYLSQAHQGKFNYIMGLWALDQGDPERASSYFTYADTYDYKDAKFYNAIALTEARSPEALAAWYVVSTGPDENQRAIAASIQKILVLPVQYALELNDAEKYQFCRYRLDLPDSALFDRLANTFENANYKAQALLDRSRRYYQAEEFIPAIKLFQRIAGLELTDALLYDDVQQFELRMLAARRELRALAGQINKGVTFDYRRPLEKIFYTALLSESSGDTTKARQHYAVLARYNPYYEEGILAAADYYRRHNPKDTRPYTILSEAIQVNANSYRLLKAYAEEAWRQGLDEYAVNAEERLRVIRP